MQKEMPCRLLRSAGWQPFTPEPAALQGCCRYKTVKINGKRRESFQGTKPGGGSALLHQTRARCRPCALGPERGVSVAWAGTDPAPLSPWQILSLCSQTPVHGPVKQQCYPGQLGTHGSSRRSPPKKPGSPRVSSRGPMRGRPRRRRPGWSPPPGGLCNARRSCWFAGSRRRLEHGILQRPAATYSLSLPRFLSRQLPAPAAFLGPLPPQLPMEKAEDGSQGFLPPFEHFATQAIHVGQEPEQWTSMAVVPPISLSTTFKQQAPGQHCGFEYSRSGNPTRNCLEKAVAALDGAKYCLAYASGLAATMNIAHLLTMGDTVICMDDVYGGTNRYFRKVASKMGLKITFVDCSKLECLEAALTPDTKLVWLETPTNPTLKVIDIQGCADVIHKHKDIILVVDNTFMSAYFQRPLSLGADICMYSATKYMNGHSDVVMGLVSVNCDDLYERLKFLQNALGAVPSPFDCYLCNRGLKTLQIRMKQHFYNALAVAQYLESNPRVEKVIYPGLPSHPQHELMKRQSTGCPGMVTFYIKGNLEHSEIFLKNLKLFALAESLGGYESLAEHPAIMTHASVPEEEREVLGINDTLIRLSIGLEDAQDILEDLEQALKAAVPEHMVRN